jgi:hypothetical protein
MSQEQIARDKEETAIHLHNEKRISMAAVVNRYVNGLTPQALQTASVALRQRHPEVPRHFVERVRKQLQKEMGLNAFVSTNAIVDEDEVLGFRCKASGKGSFFVGNERCRCEDSRNGRLCYHRVFGGILFMHIWDMHKQLKENNLDGLPGFPENPEEYLRGMLFDPAD